MNQDDLFKELQDARIKIELHQKSISDLNETVHEIKNENKTLYTMSETLMIMSENFKYLKDDVKTLKISQTDTAAQIREYQADTVAQIREVDRKVIDLENKPARDMLANASKAKITWIIGIGTVILSAITTAIIQFILK